LRLRGTMGSLYDYAGHQIPVAYTTLVRSTVLLALTLGLGFRV